jgi:hypothetical protein
MSRSLLTLCTATVVLAVSPALSGCFGGGGSDPNGEPTRIVIANPGADGVGIAIGGFRSTNLSFPFVSEIIEVSQGLALLEISFPNGQIVEQPLTIVDDELNTIGVYIPNAPDQPRTISVTTPVNITDLAFAYYQFINFAESVPLLDYYLSTDGDISDEEPVAEDVDNGEDTDFTQVVPDSYFFIATEANTKNVVGQSPGPITLETGKLYSAFNYEPTTQGGDTDVQVFELEYEF